MLIYIIVLVTQNWVIKPEPAFSLYFQFLQWDSHQDLVLALATDNILQSQLRTIQGHSKQLGQLHTRSLIPDTRNCLKDLTQNFLEIPD